MKVRNMTGRTGREVANQFIITNNEWDKNGIHCHTETFQSYDSFIVQIRNNGLAGRTVFLDETYWDYSKTTGKYRNQFLGEDKVTTQAKINSGEYKLVNLNG